MGTGGGVHREPMDLRLLRPGTRLFALHVVAGFAAKSLWIGGERAGDCWTDGANCVSRALYGARRADGAWAARGFGGFAIVGDSLSSPFRSQYGGSVS